MSELETPRSNLLGRLSLRALKLVGVAFVVYWVIVIGFAYYQYDSTLSTLLQRFDSGAAKALASIFTLIMVAIPLWPFVRILSGFARPKDFAIALVPIGMIFLVSLAAPAFTPEGVSTRYCAPNVDGTRFCKDTPGVHPETGVKLVPQTQEEALMYERVQRNIIAKRVTDQWQTLHYFDVVSGRPAVYFSKPSEASCHEAWDNPGFDGQTGQELFPATPEIVKTFRACKEKETPAQRAQPTKPTPSGPVLVDMRGESFGKTRTVLLYPTQEIHLLIATTHAGSEFENCINWTVQEKGQLELVSQRGGFSVLRLNAESQVEWAGKQGAVVFDYGWRKARPSGQACITDGSSFR